MLGIGNNIVISGGVNKVHYGLCESGGLLGREGLERVLQYANQRKIRNSFCLKLFPSK